MKIPFCFSEAHHSLWSTLYGCGDLQAAELHIREGLAQYDSQRHPAYAPVYGGHDKGVCCLDFAALTAWTQGYPDQALRYNDDAQRLARQLNHPVSIAQAIYFAAWVHHQRGEATTAVEKAMVVARDVMAGSQTAARGALLARLALKEPLEDSELQRLHQSLRSPWWPWTHTFAACLLAEAYARAGRPDMGLAVLEEIPEKSIETIYSSEIYRCRGELLLSQGHADPLEAANCFRTAVELAGRGGRRSLELRAATSLSRVLQTQGKRDDAWHTLAEIHSWFTEGFDTADLRNAKMLLDELSAAPR